MRLLDLAFKTIPAFTRPGVMFYQAVNGGYCYYWLPYTQTCSVISVCGIQARKLKLSPALTMVMLLKYPDQ